jgi:transcriptional regulator with XRE-family HTH domain
LEINNRILEIIRYYELDQRQFAEQIGITPASVSKIVKGISVPGGKILIGILTRYPDISAEWLMRGKGYMLLKKSLPEWSPLNWPQYHELLKKMEKLRKDVDGLKGTK